jgi:hypothetical protein
VPHHAAGEQLGCNRLQSGLNSSFLTAIELVQPFSPPGKPDCAHARIAAGCHDIGESKIEAPQRGEGRPDGRRQRVERDLAVGVEAPLSDR